MTDNELRNRLKNLKELQKEVRLSKELARELLIRAGIMTKNGNLAKPYK